MAYSPSSNDTAALILAIREFAREEGVEDTLLEEWALSQPSLEKRSQGSESAATAKGWRWVAEMEQTASSMGGACRPEQWHQSPTGVVHRYPRNQPHQ